MEVIIAIVSVVSSILSIILFFKIWIMTDDVAQIKKQMNKDDIAKTTIYQDIARYRHLGQEQEAYDMLIVRMGNKLNELLECIQVSPIDELQAKWLKYVEGYDKLISYLGKQMPDQYRNFNFEKYKEDLAKIK